MYANSRGVFGAPLDAAVGSLARTPNFSPLADNSLKRFATFFDRSVHANRNSCLIGSHCGPNLGQYTWKNFAAEIVDLRRDCHFLDGGELYRALPLVGTIEVLRAKLFSNDVPQKYLQCRISTLRVEFRDTAILQIEIMLQARSYENYQLSKSK